MRAAARGRHARRARPHDGARAPQAGVCADRVGAGTAGLVTALAPAVPVTGHTGPDPLLEALDRETDELYGRIDAQLERLERPAPRGAPVVAPTSVAYPALHLWRQEVRRGYQGQHADQPATWQLHALRRAPPWEPRASAPPQCAREARPPAPETHAG